MYRYLGVLLAGCVLCRVPQLHGQEGRLQRVRQEVREEKKEKKEEKKKDESRSDDDHSDDCSCDDGFGCDCGEAIWYALTSPFWAPHVALEDSFGSPGYFLKHPYLDPRAGLLWTGSLPGETWSSRNPDSGEPGPPAAKPWLVRLALEDSNDFRGLNRFNGHLLLDTSWRLGLQSSWSYLHESLGNGRHDELVLGDVNVVVRFAQSENVQFRTGLGCRVLTDRCATDWGFNFTYGADFFPMSPLIFSTVLDAGTLGEAGVFHGRATAGAVYRQCEVFIGYDYLRIGSVDLQGPLAGLRFWF